MNSLDSSCKVSAISVGFRMCLVFSTMPVLRSACRANMLLSFTTTCAGLYSVHLRCARYKIDDRPLLV